MAENSKIEWTHHTFNPWVGCTKVSPGCDHCYAEGWAKRVGAVGWGHGQRKRTGIPYWLTPLKWDAAAKAAGERHRVFCASLADVFDNDGAITSGWRGDLWNLIARTPNLDWLLLTKRPQNIKKMLPEAYGAPAWGQGWPNVWLGTTVENQAEADRRIPHLLQVPAAVRFLSCEPLLGPVDLNNLAPPASLHGPLSGYCVRHFPKTWCGCPQQQASIHWVIAGGESGPKARAMHPDWARSLRDQCQAAGVAFHFKQWGEWRHETGLKQSLENRFFTTRGTETKGLWHQWPDEFMSVKIGKANAGRMLDGREWNEFPTPGRAI